MTAVTQVTAATALQAPDQRHDVLGATLLFSLLLHGVLLLGVTFKLSRPAPDPPALDVTLVNVANGQAPQRADFLAQASNTGGGNQDHAARPSQPVSGLLPRPTPGTAPEAVPAAAPAAQPARDSRLITTTGRSPFNVASDSGEPQVEPDAAALAADQQRQQEMAQLAAEVRKKTEAYARRPKKKYISANTQEYAYAAYMRGWSDRVERVGNLNYPGRAREQKLYGDLLLTVGLKRDGSIASIEVIRSSGHPLLDAAAERIVRLAAPFPPIPQDQRVDELYITRTWEFLRGDVVRNR